MRIGWLLLASLTACGTVNGGDNAGPDAGDTSMADAPGGDLPDAHPVEPKSVRVTFIYQGDPIAGATVLLHDPTGSVVKDTVTGADGTVTLADVAGGSSVTVGKKIGLAPYVYTVLDVHPGDDIAVGDFTATAVSRFTATAALTGATSYDVGGGCGKWSSFNAVVGGTTTMQVDGLNACRTDGTWQVVGIAKDNTGKPIAYATAKVAANATANLTGWVTITPSAGYSDVLFSYSATPTGTSGVSLSLDFPYPTGLGSSISGLPAGSGSRTFRYPPVVDKLHLTVDAKDSSFETGTAVFRAVAPTPAESVNMGAVAFPMPTAVAGDFTDKSRPTFTWSAPAAGADMVTFNGGWSGNGFYQWLVVAPPTTTSVRFPSIPVEHVELIPPFPGPGTGQFFRGEVGFVDTVAPGWDGARVDPIRVERTRRAYRAFYTAR